MRERLGEGRRLREGGLAEENRGFWSQAQPQASSTDGGQWLKQHLVSLQVPNYFKQVAIDVENRLDSLTEKSKNLTESNNHLEFPNCEIRRDLLSHFRESDNVHKLKAWCENDCI